MFGFSPPQISATLQFITLTGAAIWIFGYFWPALQEQLAFIRESRVAMAKSQKAMGKMVISMEAMVISMEAVAADIKKVAEVKADVNWEKTRDMVDEVYTKVHKAIKWVTPERQKAGQQNVKRAFWMFAQGAQLLEKRINGNGRS